MVEEFLQYITSEKRYSPRTCAIYRAALEDFYRVQYPDLCEEDGSFQIGVLTPEQQKEALIFSCIRGYIAYSLVIEEWTEPAHSQPASLGIEQLLYLACA